MFYLNQFNLCEQGTSRIDPAPLPMGDKSPLNCKMKCLSNNENKFSKFPTVLALEELPQLPVFIASFKVKLGSSVVTTSIALTCHHTSCQ